MQIGFQVPGFDAVVRDLGPLLTNRELGELLGLTRGAAKYYRQVVFGVDKSKAARPLGLSEDQLVLLYALYQTERLQFIGDTLGLTARQVRDKAVTMGWKRPASYHDSIPWLRRMNYPPELQEAIRLNKQLRRALNEQHRRASRPPVQGAKRAQRSQQEG